MQLRLPWILSRRRLLAAVTLDSVLFVALYIWLSEHQFGSWPEFSFFLPVLWATWVLSSYVLGRYQGVHSLRSSSGSLLALQCVVKSILVIGISLAATLTYYWLFNIDGDYLFRSFLISYLAFWYIEFDDTDSIGFFNKEYC